MNAHHRQRNPRRRSLARRMVRRGQSIVEYGLVLSMISILTMGTLRPLVITIYNTIDEVVSMFDVSDDATPTPSASTTASTTPSTSPSTTPSTSPSTSPSTPPENLCTVPNMAAGNVQYSAALTLWTDAGFSASNLRRTGGTNNLGNFVVGSQTLAAGESVPCATATATLDARLCTVPNLVGMTVSNAQTTWDSAGFIHDNLLTPGTVADSVITTQNPNPVRNNGQPVTVLGCNLTTTVATAVCTVPNLTGLQFNAAGTSSAAHQAFVAAGFRAQRLVKDADVGDSFLIGSQTPASTTPATRIDCGSTVTVRPNLCTVPNMVGQPYAEAASTWTGAGFAAGNLRIPSSMGGNTNFTVASQSPAYSADPPTKLDCNTGSVEVQPQMCTVPNVIGQLFTPTNASWKTIGRPVAFFTNDLVAASGSTGNFTIARLTPAEGSTIVCSQQVVAEAAMCTVPSFEGLTVSAARTLNTGSWRTFNGTTYTGALNLPAGLPDGARVQAQSPAPNTQAACNTPITMASEKLCTVSSYVGSTYNAANTAFRDTAGFGVDLTRHTGDASNFTIRRQSPSSGLQHCYEPVTVSPLCVVPDANNIKLSDFRDDWADAGFTSSVTVAGGSSDLSGSNKINWQQYTAGQQMACNRPMEVAKLCSVPTVTGKKYSTANNNTTNNWRKTFTTNLVKYGTFNDNSNINWQEQTSGTLLLCNAQMRVSTSGTPNPIPSPLSTTPASGTSPDPQLP